MSRGRHLFILVLLALLCRTPNSGDVLCQDEPKAFWQLVQTVRDILEGKNMEQAAASITPGAHLVCGTRFEDLGAVVAGERKPCSLADSSYQGVMLIAKTNASEDMGFLTLKTQASDTTKVRFHTVVFIKDSTGAYKILTWHAGE